MMMPWQRSVQALWKYRYHLLFLCAGVTAAALTQLPQLRVSNSLDMWYPRNDPALLQYQQFQQRFGSDEIVIIAITSATDFDTDAGVEQVAELTDQLFYVDGVANVSSIATVPLTLREARERLLSDDGRTTVLLVQMTGGDDLESRRHDILVDLAAVLRENQWPAHFAGYGVIYDSLNQASTKGSALILAAAHLVMFVLLSAFFRRIGPVVVTLLAVSVATIWTMGLYAALGQQINMVTMVVPTLVLVIGIADCVHMLRSVARQPLNVDRKNRVINGIAAVFGPCLLTSLTTAIGFLALTLSDLPVVQNLGLFGAIGMLAAFLAACSIVIVSLSFSWAEPVAAESFLDAAAVRLCVIGECYPRTVIAVFMLLVGIAGVGLARIETDTYSIAYLADDHPARLDSDFIESEIGAYAPIDYVIRADNVLAGNVLDSLQKWQQAVRDIEAIDWSWSLLDALGVGRDIRPSALPEGEIRAALVRMRLLSPVTANAMIVAQEELRVTFAAPMMSARSVQSLLTEILARAEFPAGTTVQAAGYANLYTRIVDRIVRSQIAGFAIALGLILLVIAIATRSRKRTLFAVPANLIPIAATLGLMGWIGIPLDIATATIASVILGLIVDDTMHILRPARQTDDDLSLTITSSIRRSGGSLLMTSLVLCGGFMIMGLAEIRSLAWFGLLTSFAMLTAVITDLLLLPALARLACVPGSCSGRASGDAPTISLPAHP